MRSWFFLFCCNLMWAMQFTCIKLVQDQVGPMFTVWGPMTLAMLMLIPFVIREEAPAGKMRPLEVVRIYFVLAAFGVFPAQVMMTWGTRLSLASNAALLNLTLPVATAMFAVIFLRERMTLIRWISFAVAIAGVLLCSGIDFRSLSFGSSYLSGNLLIFAATLGAAFYNSYGKKALAFHSPMRMLFFTYVALCSMMAPIVLIEEHEVFFRIPQFTLQTWIGMGLLVFFHNYLSMILFLKALKNLDAIQAALSNYLITFFGLPIAAVWLHEKLSATAIVGGILVLCSTLVITVWEELRPARRPVPPASAEYQPAAGP
ncbi:MAG: DMT family transporter [Bryobacterales bacterium]|nr:DMT family transporter [Bryobacterales bacterium]